ncbi:MAG: glycosyltransferase family 2 protein [Bacillota bacterium]
MSTAQWLYVALIAIYATLFLIFTRIFYWKFYADRTYYRKRPAGLSESLIAEMAAQQSRDLPRFSIFIPARNEADVIEKTIDHLARLRYSPEHYEILVVTDEKEAMAAREERARITANLTPFLADGAPFRGGESEEAVLTALLSHLALEEAGLAERKAGNLLSVQEFRSLSEAHRLTILHEIALALLRSEGKADREQLLAIIRRVRPQLTAAEVSRLYPTFLSFAIPTLMLALQLRKQSGEALTTRLISQVAQARQPLTQKVLASLSETVGHRMARRLRHASAEQIAGWLQQACAIALPTTQEIVERKRLEFAAHRGLPGLKHVEVPYDFDGRVDGRCTGQWVPSTKGRALNWAFRFADPRNELWGFYDAESRPEPEVLLYVAWRRLTDGERFQLAQGPVLQVRNFWRTGPLSKIAAIYQAVSHEWQIPWLLRQIPLIGGTNFYATRDLMRKIGGFDDTVLTEDMELGVRAWLRGDAWPEFLPYSSSEQTPATYRAFFRQRLRWGAGYLQVYDKLKADNSLPEEKKRYLLRIYWWKGHFSWTIFQVAALLPIPVAILRLNNLLDPSALPPYVPYLLLALAQFSLLFTFFCFFHYYKHMDSAPGATRAFGFAQLFLLPVSAFFLPVPYSSALVLKAIGRAPRGWVKTPRTKE